METEVMSNMAGGHTPSHSTREEKREMRVSISSEVSRRSSQGNMEGEKASPRKAPCDSEEGWEVLPDGQRRRRSSVKAVKLSLKTLSEHQSEMSSQNPLGMAPRQRKRTTTETSQTEVSTESGSQGRTMSLYSAALSLRAMRITRRLSVSSFNKAMFEIPKPTQNIVKQENTFRLAAEPRDKFRPGHAKLLMEKLLEQSLRDVKYVTNEAPKMSCSLSTAIKTCIQQQQEIPRYKIISHVTIGQKKGQDIKIASRCLWDKEHDNSACATFNSAELFAVALVFAVYFE